MSAILRLRPLIQRTSLQLSLPVKLHLAKDDTSCAKHSLSNSSAYLFSQSLIPWRVRRDRPFRDHVFSPSESNIEESKRCSSTNAPHQRNIFLVVISGWLLCKDGDFWKERSSHKLYLKANRLCRMRKGIHIDLCWKKYGAGGRVVILLYLWIITLTVYQCYQTILPFTTAPLRPQPDLGLCADWTDLTCFCGGKGRKTEIRREIHLTCGIKEANLGYWLPLPGQVLSVTMYRYVHWPRTKACHIHWALWSQEFTPPSWSTHFK